MDAGLVQAATDDQASAMPLDAELLTEELIVVTATRSEVPRQASPITTEVIDRQRLLESGAQTAADALAARPGLWVDRGVAGTRGVTMQGLGPQYSLVLVDGARQIGRTDGVLDLDRFAVEDLEQIEVVRGPASVLYGSDALGGVINLVTRAPREGLAVDTLTRVDDRLGYEARGRISGGTASWGASLVATYRTAPAILREDTTDTTDTTDATRFDAYDDRHVTGRVTHQRGEAWRFDASADYLRRDLRGVSASPTGAVFDRRNLVESATASLGARWTGERTAVRIEADAGRYRDQYRSDQRRSDELDQHQVTDEHLVESRGQVTRQLARHRVLVGGEVLREALTSERLSSSGVRTRAAAYIQDEWRVGAEDRVLLVPAARLDIDSQFGSHATPRLAGRAQLGETAVARASVGAGYRAPSFKELLLRFQNPGAGYVVEGNPELGPETSLSVQMGAEWRARPWLWFAFDAYANRLRDMILITARPDDDAGALRFSYDNVGRARTLGLEGYAIATRGRAALELGYALNRSRDLDADRPLEGVPAHRLTATARWRDHARHLDAFATAALTGHRPLYLSAEPRMATLTERRVELSARVAKRLRSGVGAFVGVDNLLDAGDPELDHVTPRTLYAGVEFHR